ncbi:MAG: aminotransferase class III-fold pyridoxal phosphate-dependent enzyme, partial [Candidatus Latescibacteria bacterium]|nr:aminotransferase class III-fold pyridoxal phosphate-dependent enzyme [Candidatus Latescibacterota bacterium]
MTATKGGLFHRDLAKEYPVIVRGEGIYMIDEEGRQYIDGIAGAGNVTLGHGQARIAQAMGEQAETLAYCFSAFFTNRPALELAPRVGELAPGDLNSCYFVSGGSEAVETAFKLARQYHLQQGRSQKHKIISRWRGYHGATLGAMAASGLPPQRNPFAPLLPEFPHIAACHPYRCDFAGCEGVCNLSCARELEAAIVQAGPENVAAFVAEPVVMAGAAVAVPPPGYFEEIRAICDRYDVLWIADEIMTGFGRTGRYFA